MDNFIVPAAFVVALILALLFGAAFGGRKFWRGFILFFLIIFLVGWSSQLWIMPFGPVWWGVAWLPLIFVAVVFSFLMLAFTPRVNGATESSDKNSQKSSGVALGIFFWFLVVMLVTSVALGYYRISSS